MRAVSQSQVRNEQKKLRNRTENVATAIIPRSLDSGRHHKNRLILPLESLLLALLDCGRKPETEKIALAED